MRFFLDYQKTNMRNDYVNYSVTKLPEHLNTKNRKPDLSPGFRFSFHRTVHNRTDDSHGQARGVLTTKFSL